MSERPRGTAVPVTNWTGSMSVEVRRGREMTGNSGRGRHCWRDQVGPPAAALPALEVAVGRRCTTLSGRQLVGVHGQAHRAAGLAPLKARRGEDAIQTLLLGLRLDHS